MNSLRITVNSKMIIPKENITKLILGFGIIVSLNACRQPATKKVSEDKWYTASGVTLCDERKGIFLDPQKLTKYGKHVPYNYTKISSGDSVKISFDLISDCCLDYKGEAEIVKDTLILDYRLTKDTIEPCDCYCDYKIVYSVSKTYNWKKIRVRNILLE